MTATKEQTFAKARELTKPAKPADQTDELVAVILSELEERYVYPPVASFALYLSHDLADLALALKTLGDKMQELADAEV